jgi:uncharacterized protein
MPEVIVNTPPLQYLFQLGILQLRLTGTLGILLKAHRLGKIQQLSLLLDQLERLNFRLDSRTRDHVLHLAE